MVLQFDTIILGGGKGGKTLAMDLAKSGQKVAMVENNQIGGTCINVACIPTKTLVQAAKVAHFCRKAKDYGLNTKLETIDFKAIRARKEAVVKGMREANLKQFLDSGMDLMLGHGHFIGPKMIEVILSSPRDNQKTLHITADKIIINTGALPYIPPITGLDKVNYFTNDSLMNTDSVPRHLLIIGGGYIGLEFAQMFRRFGSEVTVIEASREFLGREDKDIAEQVFQTLSNEGIQFAIDTKINAIRQEQTEVIVEANRQGPSEIIRGTAILVAVGRIANTAGLHLDKTGVELDERGFIKVNEYLETTAAGIWALGDVKGGAQFTHLSLDDYRLVKHNLQNPQEKLSSQNRLIPYTVFLDPELARIGLTEVQARSQGRPIKIAKIPAAAIPRAKTQGETIGVLKAVIDTETDLILGVSIFCAEAGEILGVIQLAMELGVPYKKLRDMMFAHPTLVEGINLWFAQII
ncbi:mercuric reductase [Legionella pneumophila]|uniref:Pyridine nucleotide-disulfide oxidoreductase n=1 Tax=Legionella pneumophila subsp. pascullei TaxID=91890 RepID=A0AAX2IT74_LEGPN|nr:mercuric reductase [Legionella pneumophila]AMP88415.1 pyridine nucleotide-disulfide oxidoreductase [Legionella pneumophila subsp. pascullei]AMP91324.1 pyridine nucleotide-disulfide oxidoreductase [Legionella pneumophila subsp. pascullei]AMP94312.1 pyridine nucleotide-disulfide oxidoreductase [Legionella pneumophila subsp. pascullei]SQG89101.1 pyridine nucleotide-disulfide oxidoreductase [Legionella pneumophila subsp. pascullei]VEH04151.1 pyridine nucleotide-disulfide oxidoreductase [Legione